MFGSKNTEMDSTNKLKEGLLKKESRHRKIWRDRWVVLTEANIYTFENKGVYKNPTEVIDVKTIKTVKTDETKKGFNFVRKYFFILFFLLNRKLLLIALLFFLKQELLKKKKPGLALLGKLW